MLGGNGERLGEALLHEEQVDEQAVVGADRRRRAAGRSGRGPRRRARGARGARRAAARRCGALASGPKHSTGRSRRHRLGRVDADEPHRLLRPADVDDDRVAVDRTHDRAPCRPGGRRAARSSRRARRHAQRARSDDERPRARRTATSVAIDGRSGRPAPASGGLEALDDGAGAEAAAAAHRHEAVAAAGALELVEGLGDRTAPVPPSGWPRAMAPPLGLVCSAVKPSSFCQASTTEANASLISATSMSSIAEAGALEQALGGVDRAGEHEHRVDADEAGVDDAGPGPQARAPRPSRPSSAARRRRRRRSATTSRRCGRRRGGRPA